MRATVGSISVTPVESSPVASVAPDGNLRTGKITTLGEGGCSQQIFDNQTGHLVPSRQPCEAAHDGAEAAHRLDALSKSFSGR
jgi:hypothetical protein